MVAVHLAVPAAPVSKPGAQHQRSSTGTPKRNAAIHHVISKTCVCRVKICPERTGPILTSSCIYPLDVGMTINMCVTALTSFKYKPYRAKGC